MFENLITYLDKNEIKHSIIDNEQVATFSMRTEKGDFQCIADVKEDSNIFIFYTTISIRIPENKRLIACELLTRINYGIIIGNFEMDIDDGEIRYKTSIDYEGSTLINEFIDTTISANLSIVDNYFYAIVEIITSDLSPKEILDKYENIEISE